MLRRIGSLFSLRLVSAAVQALVLVYLARLLGPASFAGLTATLALGAVLATAFGFGGQAQALRLLAVPDYRQYATTLTVVRIATAIVTGFIASVAGASFFGLDWFFGILAGTYSASEAIVAFSQHLLLGVQDTRRANVSVLLKPVLTIMLIASAVALGLEPLVGFAAGGLLSALVAALLAAPHMDGAVALRRVVRDSRAYWASTTLASVQQLDVAVVTLLAPGGMAGSYAGATRLVNPLNLAVTSILSIVTPNLSRRDLGDRGRVFRRAFWTVSAVAALFLLATPVLVVAGPAVLGDGYGNSGPFFGALGVALAVNSFAQFYAASFYAIGEARRLALVRVWTAPIGLAVIGVASLSGSFLWLAIAVVAARCIELAILHIVHGRSASWQ